MISQDYKSFYFTMVKWTAKPVYFYLWCRYRLIRPSRPLSLHLGSGANYIDGVLNIDGNVFARKDVWLDLRNGLPFPDESAGWVYSCHTLEHLLPNDVLMLLREIRRILTPSGYARIVVPSFEFALEIASGAVESEWPRKFQSPTAQAINYLFCDGQHAYAYSLDLMQEFVKEAGFPGIAYWEVSRSGAPRGGLECPVSLPDEPIGSLVVELKR